MDAPSFQIKFGTENLWPGWRFDKEKVKLYTLSKARSESEAQHGSHTVPAE